MKNSKKTPSVLDEISLLKDALNTAVVQNSQLKLLIDNMNDLVCEIDEFGVYTFVNQQFKDTLGYIPEDLIGHKATDMIHPDDLTKSIERYDEVKKTLEKSVDIWRFRHKNGNYLTLESRSAIYYNEKKEKRTVVISRDITEKKLAEKKLLEQEERQVRLTEEVPALLALVSSDLRYEFVNARYEQFFNKPRTEILKKKVSEVIGEEPFKRGYPNIQKALSGDSVDFENIVTNHLGQQRNMFTSYRPFQNAGMVKGIVVQVLDITDSKKAEEDLRYNKEKFQMLFENMVHGVFYQSKDGSLTDINPSGLRMFGLTRDQFLSRTSYHSEWKVVDEQLNYIPPDQHPSIIARNTGQKVNSVVAVYNPLEQAYRWLMVSASPLVPKNESAPYEVFVTMHDITDRKLDEDRLVELNQQLNELNSTKDKLLSIIAHDLRSPFNSILGFSEMMMGTISSTDDAIIEDQIGRIHQTALDTYYLLENLLAWATSQTSKIEYYPTSISLDTIISHCIRMLKPNADLKKISLELNIPNNLIIEADSHMIRSVFRNLLSNAIKFTRKTGQIQINAYIENQLLTVEIKDNGVGIPKEQLSAIFKRNEYHTTQGTENEHGSGLGLSICQEFIELHKGRISIDSQVGKGTLVTIRMPLTQKHD